MAVDRCSKCGAATPRRVGALCHGCADALPRERWHVPGVARSTVALDRAAGWLIDPWGMPHAIEARSTIGRGPGSSLFIADRQVSVDHAELVHDDGQWSVRDRGSAAGTHVGNERNVRRAPVGHLDVVTFATIGFYLWGAPEPPATVAAPLVATALPRPISYALQGTGGQTLIATPKLGRPVDQASGTLRLVGDGSEATGRPLSTLQFQLLRQLCEKAIHDSYAASQDGGFVDTGELLATLPFQSSRPTGDNVRQVVLGLRSVLVSMNVAIDPAKPTRTTLIESVERLGYRLTWPVTYADPASDLPTET